MLFGSGLRPWPSPKFGGGRNLLAGGEAERLSSALPPPRRLPRVSAPGWAKGPTSGGSSPVARVRGRPDG